MTLMIAQNGWPEHVLDSWRHFIPSSMRFQWRRIACFGVCVSNIHELHQDHPGRSWMKSDACTGSHLWWHGLDLDFEKQVLLCLCDCQSTSCCCSSPMGVAILTLATFACRFCRPIHGSNVPIGGGRAFQLGGSDRYGKVYNWHKLVCGCSLSYFCGIWIPQQIVTDNGLQFTSE